MNDTDARYEVTKARPGDDPLGDVDRLIVDRAQQAVVAVVYGPELAEIMCNAAEDHRLWGDPELRLKLGGTTGRIDPETGEEIRTLTVDLSEEGSVGFHHTVDWNDSRLIRHEVYALHAALGAWLNRNAH